MLTFYKRTGSGTRKFRSRIQIRNKSFQIHNTANKNTFSFLLHEIQPFFKHTLATYLWMDPGFFADPDPDFKNLNPDPDFNKLMGSK